MAETITKTQTKKSLDVLFAEHKISEAKKAEQRWKDFFKICRCSAEDEKYVRENYSVYEKLKN